MKKTYINPNIEVVMIDSAKHMLAGSEIQVQGNYDSNTVTIGSRGTTDWDDEE